MTTRFKVGDKVIEINRIEDIYEVREIFTRGLIHVVDRNGHLFGYQDYQLKLVEDIPKLNKQINDTIDRIVEKTNIRLGTPTKPQKADTGKPRLDLVRPEFILGLGEVLAFGAEKYDEPVGTTPNYLKGEGFNYSRILGSLERHIQQFKMGENIDPESGKHHLKHAAANLMFLLAYEESEKGIDDRIILEKK